MRLTRAGEYAVRCLIYLAQQPGGSVVKRRTIAQAMDIPYQFLGKIGQKMAGAGLIHIAQGARGGYRLAREAEAITLLDVVEAVDGEIFLNDCVMWPSVCNRSETCTVHQVWQRARDELRRILSSVDFATLAGGKCE